MADTPEWETLADALQRVMATGVTEDKAKNHICLALADQKIRVQVTIADTEVSSKRGKTRTAGIGIPRDLAPDDFNWVHSRPLKPWLIGPATVAESYFSVFGSESLRIASIKLFRADVTQVLCGGERTNNKPENTPTASAAQESAAIKALSSHLKANPDLARADARACCYEKGFSLTGRGFQDRVWPQARKEAGLDPRAAPGRKRKS